MGSLSSKTSAPLATRSEGRMQETRTGAVRAAPTPQLCQAPTPTLPHGHSLSLSSQSFSLPPLSWRLGKEKYLRQCCLLAAALACWGSPAAPPPKGGPVSDTLLLHSGSSGPQPGLHRPLPVLGRVCRLWQKREHGWGWSDGRTQVLARPGRGGRVTDEQGTSH